MRRILHDELYSLSSYSYALPPENIAQSPANPRDSSRLLVWNVREKCTDTSHHFRDIVSYLRPDDLLILNDTRVIPARLLGTRPTGGKCEVFLLRNITPDFLEWEALVKPARKLQAGSVIDIQGVKAEVTGYKGEGIRTVRFALSGREEFMKFLDEAGNVPLPPYIHAGNEMRTAYQTVFAKHDGSAAAPTASLHFTPELLSQIQALGVGIGYVTLHVGLGTFRPVFAQDIREHDIHTEHCELSAETAAKIRECKARGGRVIASGTTAARTLETFAGESGSRDTGLYIYPGYRFRVVDALITNFHLPQSSLIMLVAAFASNLAGTFGREEETLCELLDIYENAARDGWRFFSFGDAMFIH
ncbi:MAG: tRNA preQ1(34) S-adenosylmethionine ribosyltransferase-isomerase QueA [Synergistaceae bacterium]|nr:tRNA preQ1(34) S-adenosylmethionine ribosyltransferase-isomerase QueA [Synergistaceae bacterium]